MDAIAQTCRFGVFELDAAAGQLRKSGVLIKLAPQPWKVLFLLASRPGEVISRDEFREAIWGSETYVDFDAALNVCIRQIRAALNDDADHPRYVETLPRHGYRFVAPVQVPRPVVDAPAPPATEPPSPLPVARVRRSRWFLAGGSAALLTGAVAGLILWHTRPPGSEPRISSIAVLPFEDLSLQKDQAFLCEGMAEELMFELSLVDGLKVMARGSAFRFGGKNVDERDVGAKLHVDSVLAGSLRREGDRLRITARLVDARNGYQLWSGEYDEKLENLLAVQRRVADAILLNLRLSLRGEQAASRSPANSNQVGTYELYLQGRYHLSKRNGDALRKSIEIFREAIAGDPGYAPAHAGLADAFALLGNNGSMPPERAFSDSRAEALEALRLNERLPEAHVSRGFVAWLYDADWPVAEASFRRAIELSPGYSEGHHMYGHVLQQTGRLDQALVEMKLAGSLDPLSLPISEEIGHTLYLQRKYDDAIQQYWKTLAVDASFVRAYESLGWAYVQKGMYEEAAAAMRKSGGIRGLSGQEPETDGVLAYVAARAGRVGEARKWLRTVEAKGRPPQARPRTLAMLHLALGEREAALAWLERACDQRPFGANYLKADPVWDALRSDPRFTALLARLRL